MDLEKVIADAVPAAVELDHRGVRLSNTGLGYGWRAQSRLPIRSLGDTIDLKFASKDVRRSNPVGGPERTRRKSMGEMCW